MGIFSQLAQASREEEDQQKRSRKGLAFEVDLPTLPTPPELPEKITRVRAAKVKVEGTQNMKAVVDSMPCRFFDMASGFDTPALVHDNERMCMRVDHGLVRSRWRERY